MMAADMPLDSDIYGLRQHKKKGEGLWDAEDGHVFYWRHHCSPAAGIRLLHMPSRKAERQDGKRLLQQKANRQKVRGQKADRQIHRQ